MRSQVQGSPFRVIFLSVRRTQTGLLLTLLICWQVLDMPARALTPICFFNHALKSPNNLFFAYIHRSRMAGGFAVNPQPLNPEPVNGYRVFMFQDAQCFEKQIQRTTDIT